MPPDYILDLVLNLIGNLCGWIAMGLALAATVSKNWISYGSYEEGLFERCVIGTGNCNVPNDPSVMSTKGLLITFIILIAFATFCNYGSQFIEKKQLLLRIISMVSYFIALIFAIGACVVYTYQGPHNQMGDGFTYGHGFNMVWTALGFTVASNIFVVSSLYFLRKLH